MNPVFYSGDWPELTLVRLLEALPLPSLLLYRDSPDRTYPNPAWSKFIGEFVEAFAIESLDHLLGAGSVFPETCVQTWQTKRGESRQIQVTWQPILSDSPSWMMWLEDVTEGSLSSKRSLNSLDPGVALPLLNHPSSQIPKREIAIDAEMVQVNRLKDEFLACVSHELRSPLTALLGLSKLLQDPMMGELSDRQRRYAQLIHRSGKQLISIVNDILDFTRMETGHLDLHPSSVDLAQVCRKALDQVQHHSPDAVPDASEQPWPSFTMTIEPGLESLVADPTRLQQMLRHLISNALKFTSSEGMAGLRVSRWEGWVAFTVWDTGIGIPADKQHLIFQKFQQLENPMTRQFEGTGLGLVLTQRLARLHGGDVTFSSRPGKGSEFTLLLPPTPPIAAVEPLRNLLSRPPTPTHPNRMVLVVESSVRNLEDLMEQLTELDYRVAIARSGTEALEKARKLQPCAILINPFLPMLSGWDVLTLLKSDSATRHIPLVVTATRSEQQRAYGASADGFLRIPISPRSLMLMLERVTTVPETQSSEVRPSSRTLLCLYLQELQPEHYSIEMASEQSPTPILQANHYRVIEAYDAEQAEMLARVWKPNAVILVGSQSRPSMVLNQIIQQTYLASLPIVTLDPVLSQAAQQISGLAVFPCPQFAQVPTAVLQTINVAIGFGGRPSVLMVDSAQWSDVETSKSSKSSEWLQALMQYLQTAGLRGRLVGEQREMVHRLRSQGVDLLLVYWQDGTSEISLQEGLAALTDLETPPAVLILDYRSAGHLDPVTLPYSVIKQPKDMTLVLQKIQQCLGV
jgi:signal transduction histidine kinase/CheY-like chemotaxis protein